MEFSKGLWFSTWSEASSLCTLIWMGFSSKILMAQGKAILSLSAYIAKRLSRKFLQLTFPMSSANFQLYSVAAYPTEVRPWLWCRYGLLLQDSVHSHGYNGVKVVRPLIAGI